MKQLQSSIAVLCVLLVAAPPSFAQEPTVQPHPRWYSGIVAPYQARPLAPVNVSNSSRMDALLRAGNLYLSLADSIALALENNLDVEIERYEFSIAEADLLRAHSGASIQGIPTGVLPGVPTGANLALLGSSSAGLAAPGDLSALAAMGNPALSFDPIITGNLNFGHATAPQSNTVTTGTTALITTNKTANFGISQSFLSGGTVSLAYNNIVQDQNSARSTVNPFTTSSLDLSAVQPLLQGFGFAQNNRTIRIAKNNVKAADFVFRQQLINTVANVVQLYWNLVAAISTVGVNNQAVAVAQKLYDDNKTQVNIGTLAPIEVVRAEAQLATAQQALVAAQSAVLQLESVLKSALSRNGLMSQSIMDAHVVPTDPIRIPEVEAVEPIQDLVSRALDTRPDLAQSRIQIDNAQIALSGTRNALLPTLNATGDFRSNALVGAQNALVGPGNIPANLADPFFIGGYGSILAQLFGRSFPTYSVGLSLNIPLRNRAAQANVATASLNLRQNQLFVQRQVNQIRVDVKNAMIALDQARAQYQAAVKGRVLQEQTLDADQKKLALGATTVYQVIQDQRDLTTAAAAEVTAQATYAGARVQLDVSTGSTLSNNNVVLDEAKAGRVSRVSTAPPNVP